MPHISYNVATRSSCKRVRYHLTITIQWFFSNFVFLYKFLLTFSNYSTFPQHILVISVKEERTGNERNGETTENCSMGNYSDLVVNSREFVVTHMRDSSHCLSTPHVFISKSGLHLYRRRQTKIVVFI